MYGPDGEETESAKDTMIAADTAAENAADVDAATDMGGAGLNKLDPSDGLTGVQEFVNDYIGPQSPDQDAAHGLIQQITALSAAFPGTDIGLPQSAIDAYNAANPDNQVQAGVTVTMENIEVTPSAIAKTLEPEVKEDETTDVTDDGHVDTPANSDTGDTTTTKVDPGTGDGDDGDGGDGDGDGDGGGDGDGDGGGGGDGEGDGIKREE
jgi:hypothetical protein